MAGGPCEFGLAPYPSLDVATARTLAPADSHISTFLMFRQLGEDVDEFGRRVDREADLLAGDRMRKPSDRACSIGRAHFATISLAASADIARLVAETPPPPIPPVRTKKHVSLIAHKGYTD